MNNIMLEYPWVLLLAIVFLICHNVCRPKLVAIYFPNIDLLQKSSKTNQWLNNLLKSFVVISLLLALASPVEEDKVIIKKDKGYEISLILDASGSMRENNKFLIVKEIVQSFIDQRIDDKLALSIFADFAYVAVPLTYDKKSIKRLLSQINVGIAGNRKTALYEALFVSSNLFKESKSKEKIAILLTDGLDTTNSVPLNVAINTAKKYKIKVYTVGVGREGIDFSPDVLQKISSATGGKYFAGDSVSKIESIYKEINNLEKSEIKSDKYIKKTYYFYYLLWLSLFWLFLLILKNNWRK